MANDIHKIKLLMLWDILCKNTDEDHAMNTDEIINRLGDRGIEVSRKTVVEDIKTLCAYGYEVLSYKKKFHYYYVVNRSLDTAEVVMLADAVNASKTIREEFIRHNAELADKAIKSAKKELQIKRKRTEELSRLMQLAYEDRLKGKMPEDICLNFIQRYSEEQKKLEAEIAELEERLTETTNTIQSADEFIRNIKKYLEAPELTREMCYELLDRVVVGGHPKHTGKERVIDIVYKVDIASVLRYKLNNPNK